MALKNLSRKQIATTTFPYNKFSLDYTLDSLEKIGCPNFEFQAVNPLLSLEDATDADLHVIAKKIKDHHLHCICVTPDVMNYPINLGSANEKTRQRSIHILKRAVDAAKIFEAPYVQMHVGYSLIDEKAEDAWARSRQSMKELGDYAYKNGVIITSEYSVFTWKSVLQSSKALRKLIDEVDSKGYQGMTDTVVMVKIPEVIEDAVNNLGDHLRHVHFTDGIGDATSSLHMIPGDGKLPLEHQLQVLDDSGFKDYLSLEIQGHDSDPHEAMLKSYKWMVEHLPEGE